MTPAWFRGRGFLVDADFARESAHRQFSVSIMLMIVLAIIGGMLLAARSGERDPGSATATRVEKSNMALARPISANVRYVDKPNYRYQFGAAVAVNEH
jgi:hypothetical protein